MRLSEAGLSQLPSEVECFTYDRATQAIGIVHFGIGAFHRAHQAWYTDRAMDAGDRHWSILGVSLRSDAVARSLNPQDGLYSLTEKSRAGDRMRVIGAVSRVAVGQAERDSIVAALASRSCHVASFTVTEKGYCRAHGGGLDLAAAADSFYPLLADGFRRRREANLGGLTLISCDNLSANGQLLHALIGQYLNETDPDLRRWLDSECACPSTMVDRIVPAVSDADRAHVSARLGMEDAAPVLAGHYADWIIESRFAGPTPRWSKVGARLVGDVASFEAAKLRLLNGAHSLLAYVGGARGHEFVHQAIGDPEIRPLVEQFLRGEVAPTLGPMPDLDLDAYIDAILSRFDDRSIAHRLSQIAMDGSQKLAQRWLVTLRARRASGLDSPAIIAGLVAWLRHVRGTAGTVEDPRASEMATMWKAAGAEGVVRAILGTGGIFGEPLPEQDLVACERMLRNGPDY